MYFSYSLILAQVPIVIILACNKFDLINLYIHYTTYLTIKHPYQYQGISMKKKQ